LHEGDGIEAGLDVLGHLEDLPIVGLDLDLGVVGDLGQQVAGAAEL
jgi:hypothetical protein